MDSWKKSRSAEAELSLIEKQARVNLPPSRFQAVPLLAPARHFDPLNPELLDRPDVDQNSVRDELQALETANRRFGGYQLVLHYVARLVRNARLTSLTVLDLGTGLADIPRALVAWGQKRGVQVAVTAVDVNEKVLDLARQACRDWPDISIEYQNILRLTYAANSFDLVMSSMALHHFETADAIALLRRMQEIARSGYIVNDLRRNWLTIWFTEALARTVIRKEILKHDAAYSSRAAFTVDELNIMAQEAGLQRYRIHRHHLIFRMVLEGIK